MRSFCGRTFSLLFNIHYSTSNKTLLNLHSSCNTPRHHTVTLLTPAVVSPQTPSSVESFRESRVKGMCVFGYECVSLGVSTCVSLCMHAWMCERVRLINCSSLWCLLRSQVRKAGISEQTVDKVAKLHRHQAFTPLLHQRFVLLLRRVRCSTQ